MTEENRQYLIRKLASINAYRSENGDVPFSDEELYACISENRLFDAHTVLFKMIEIIEDEQDCAYSRHQRNTNNIRKIMGS